MQIPELRRLQTLHNGSVARAREVHPGSGEAVGAGLEARVPDRLGAAGRGGVKETAGTDHFCSLDLRVIA